VLVVRLTNVQAAEHFSLDPPRWPHRRFVQLRSASRPRTSKTTTPSTSSEARPSGSNQLPMSSPSSPGRPVLRLMAYPIIVAAETAPAISHTRTSSVRINASASTKLTMMSPMNLQLGEHRHTHLMQRGEGELTLGLDPRGADRPAIRGLLERAVQERGLSDTDVPPDHHGPALAGTEIGDEAVEFLAFAAPVQQHRRTPWDGEGRIEAGSEYRADSSHAPWLPSRRAIPGPPSQEMRFAAGHRAGPGEAGRDAPGSDRLPNWLTVHRYRRSPTPSLQVQCACSGRPSSVGFDHWAGGPVDPRISR